MLSGVIQIVIGPSVLLWAAVAAASRASLSHAGCAAMLLWVFIGVVDVVVSSVKGMRFDEDDGQGPPAFIWLQTVAVNDLL